MPAPLRRPLAWLLFAAVVSSAGLLWLRARGPLVKTVVVTARDIEQHVVASGRVWVPTRVQVAAQVAGLVLVVAVTEGQHVKAGDILVQIDDGEARAEVEQARASLAQAKARVDQLRRVGAIVASEGLRQAEANLARAEQELERTQTLVAGGALARVELEEARRVVQVARAQKAAAEAQQLAAAPMGADSRVALTALLQAQAQLTGAEIRLAQTRVTALHDGVVLSRGVQPGDVVQPAKTLLVMAAAAAPELVFHPDERNLAFIALGQRARASADAFPQHVFEAHVNYIAPAIDPERGSIEVRLRVQDPPAFLKPDMTVSVDLTVAAKRQAPTLPSEAVRAAALVKPWVWAVENQRVVRREVTLGIQGEGAVEIASGLALGAEVVALDGQVLTPGQRVRTERQ